MNRPLVIFILLIGVLFINSSTAQSKLEFQLITSGDNDRSVSLSTICGEGLVLPSLEYGQRSRLKLRITNPGNERIVFKESPALYPETSSIQLVASDPLVILQPGEIRFLELAITNDGSFNGTRTELKMSIDGSSDCSVVLQLLEKVENLDVTKVDRLEDGEEVFRGGKIPFEIKVKNAGDEDLNDVEVETPLGDYLSVDPGSIRTSPLAIDDEYMGMMGGLNIDAANGVKANDFDDDLPNTTIQESGSSMATQEGGSVTLQNDGSFVYTPPVSPPVSGMDMFIYTLIDGNPLPGVVDNNDARVTILLNNPPTANNQMVTILEDEMPAPMIILTGSDPDMDMLMFMVVDDPTIGVLSGTPPNLTYTPNADENGNDSFTFKVNDGQVDSPLATVSIEVTPVNDAPSFAKGGDQSVNEDAGAQTVNGWATSISKGPANESSQNLTFNVTGNTNPGLFSAGPTVNSSGDLGYTPAADANGSAIIQLELQDDGGTLNGGIDTSPAQTFNINIAAVNDPPTITCGSDQAVLNTAGAQVIANWATGISVGPANESGQNPPIITVANDNNALFIVQPAVSTSGILSFTPASGATGFANVTVTISDGIVSDDVSCNFTITVQAAPLAMDDDFTTRLDNEITGNNLFSDNGNGLDDLGFPAATTTFFGGGSLGGNVTDNGAGSTIGLAGGTLQVNSNGTFSLTGQPFVAGTYTFDYRLQNAAGFSDATVTLIITTADDPAICNADSYSGTGNIAISIDAVNGVLSNDGGTNLVVEAVEGMGANVGVATAATNGTVTCNADGSFTFEPTAGASTGSFSYTVDNPLNMPQTCTVTIKFTQMIWFVDVNGTGTNSGTFLNPFQSIAAFNAVNNGMGSNPATGDFISLASGTYSEADGISLLNNQKLIGEGVVLSTYFSAHVNSISSYEAFAGSAATRPVITVTSPGNNGIDVREGNTIRGLNIGNTVNQGIADFAPVGLLTISDLSITGTGFAMELDNGGMVDISIDELSGSSTNQFQPILVLESNLTGSFRCTSGTMSNTGPVIKIDGNSLNLDVTLNSASGDGQFTAEAITGINIQDVTGSFTITGNGMPDSGGEIKNFPDDGIRLNNASNISLTNIKVQDCGNAMDEHGIEMNEVVGMISIINSKIIRSFQKNVLISNTLGQANIILDGTGVDENDMSFGEEGIYIKMAGNHIPGMETQANIVVNNTTIINNRGASLNIMAADNAKINQCDITGCSINSTRGVFLSAANESQFNFNVIGNGLIGVSYGESITANALDNAVVNGRVNNNSDITTSASAGNTRVLINKDQSALMIAEIKGNTINNIGSFGGGIAINAQGNAVQKVHSVISNNTLNTIPGNLGSGISIFSFESSQICSKVNNNSVIPPPPSGIIQEFSVGKIGTGLIELENFNVDALGTWNLNGNSTNTNISEAPFPSVTAAGSACTIVSHPIPTP